MCPNWTWCARTEEIDLLENQMLYSIHHCACDHIFLLHYEQHQSHEIHESHSFDKKGSLGDWFCLVLRYPSYYHILQLFLQRHELWLIHRHNNPTNIFIIFAKYTKIWADFHFSTFVPYKARKKLENFILQNSENYRSEIKIIEQRFGKFPYDLDL